MPQRFFQGTQSSMISPSFKITCVDECPDPLPAAIARYANIISFAGAPMSQSNVPQITELVVTAFTSVKLGLGMDESYELDVPAKGQATLTATTQWGALRGLESFSQLINWSPAAAGNNYTVANTPVKVLDFPRFKWRGVLIDSARHFLTVSAIKTTLDAMSYNKFNRLHWHVVDDESWPLESSTYPRFSEAGAYAPDAVYTHADVQEIVQYAYERGISVVPEFDGPAHASAWGKGYPNLVISCPTGQALLNPIDGGGVYETIEGLLDEFVPLFNTDFIHFGGDEVEDFTCWEQSAAVQAFMASKGYTTMYQLRDHFETRLQDIARSKNLTTMFWEEVFDGNYTLQHGTIIDIWDDGAELANAVRRGVPVIGSYGFYLDQQVPPGPKHYFWVDTWQNFYINEPIVGQNFTKEQADLVVGLSASQWGEQVDAVNIQSRMWPRGCASAERMWSDATVNSVEAAAPRLEHMRCHMVQRGIGAGPIRPSATYGYCPLPKDSRYNFLHVNSFSVPTQ